MSEPHNHVSADSVELDPFKMLLDAARFIELDKPGWAAAARAAVKSARARAGAPAQAAPGQADLMVTPESIDAFLDVNPPPASYADLVRELGQAAEEYDRGHGPLHAAAANAIQHLETLLHSAAHPPAAPVEQDPASTFTDEEWHDALMGDPRPRSSADNGDAIKFLKETASHITAGRYIDAKASLDEAYKALIVDCPRAAPTYGIIDPDYARIFTMSRCLAWAEGYALLFHGSFTRDLDLIAVPWTSAACEPEHLVKRIVAAADLRSLDEEPSAKEHGRLSWTLVFKTFGDPRFIDFSVAPRITDEPQAAPVTVPSSVLCPHCGLQGGHSRMCQDGQ
jgi:hypothetical protein